MDLSKLTRLDTEISVEPVSASCNSYIYGDGTKEEAEFQKLARIAFDVMVRRGWAIQPCGHYESSMSWYVKQWYGELKNYGTPQFDDPFTAIVEADAWIKAQEAKEKA